MMESLAFVPMHFSMFQHSEYWPKLSKLSIGENAFSDYKEATTNLDTSREYVISQIDELLYLSKETYKQQIPEQSTKENIWAILKKAQTDDDIIYQEEQSNRELLEAKQSAISVVDVCKYLTPEEKKNYNAQIYDIY